MPTSKRFIPRDRVAGVSPMRLQTLLDGAQAVSSRARHTVSPAQGSQDELQRAYEAGYKAGVKSAAARHQAERSTDKALLGSIERQLSSLNDDVAANILELAVDIAEHVTRAQIALHPESILAIVREALQVLRDDISVIRIMLHPDDAALIEGSMGAELQQRNCRVIASAALKCGDCRVESSLCEIDASVAARWRQVLQPLGVSHEWIG